jgi:hypothetical protein
MHSSNKYNDVGLRLLEIFKRQQVPDLDEYSRVLKKVNAVLMSEDEQIRPRDPSGLPGGIIYLKKNIPTLIVPDIHARMDFILNIMLDKGPDNICNLQKLESDELQIVCVGDGVHGEKRAAKRWSQAYKEFQSDFSKHVNIDEEMKESFGTMEMIMEVKSNFPSNFHFLKGNHENIKNEEGGGNFPFIKFSYEGPIVAYYVNKFYGEDFLNLYSEFEKNMPLLAVGKNFVISHSEPMDFYSKEEIIGYRNKPGVVEGLTWTADDAANNGSVKQMLDYYIENEQDKNNCFYFGGHRPVKNLYNSRANGQYVQIHNPDKFIIVNIGENDINLERDIIELKNNTEKILQELN